MREGDAQLLEPGDEARHGHAKLTILADAQRLRLETITITSSMILLLH